MFEFVMSFINIMPHVDKYLTTIVDQYGFWIYGLLFLIIFCETGLVFTPFLPGDSLLFAVGTLAAQNIFNISWLYAILLFAAILGDTVNYWAGFYLGSKVFREKIRFLKREYLIRTEQFYEAHGNKTIVLARFIPIIRTFAPFVAGIGRMKYSNFLAYNIIGGFAWITLFLWGGYYFGNVAMIKQNFYLVIWIIIALSFAPIVIELIKHRKKRITAQ